MRRGPWRVMVQEAEALDAYSRVGTVTWGLLSTLPPMNGSVE